MWQLDNNHSPQHSSQQNFSSTNPQLAHLLDQYTWPASQLTKSSTSCSCPSFLSQVQTCQCLTSWPYPFKSGAGPLSPGDYCTLWGSTDGRDRLPAGIGMLSILTGDWPTDLAVCSALRLVTQLIVLLTYIHSSSLPLSFCSISFALSFYSSYQGTAHMICREKMPKPAWFKFNQNFKQMFTQTAMFAFVIF